MDLTPTLTLTLAAGSCKTRYNMETDWLRIILEVDMHIFVSLGLYVQAWVDGVSALEFVDTHKCVAKCVWADWTSCV